MIGIVLICTLIGYLCGSALIGLGVGIGIFALALWADSPTIYRPKRGKRRK